MAEISHGRSCDTCKHTNICKYQEEVKKEVETMVQRYFNSTLPLTVNINCQNWDGKVQLRNL